MSSTLLKHKLQEEIDLIPEDKLTDLYNVIHCFRLGAEKNRKINKEEMLSFAGCWKDMDNRLFQSFETEIAERRSNAFLDRRKHESGAD